ncbi:MAG: hypothetical protein ACRDRO_06830 [Pseudonocardiaceae bacterium]
MAASHERTQREPDRSSVSLNSFSAWPGMVLDRVVIDDFAYRFNAHELDWMKVLAEFRRADELDAEAAYYTHRALQEEQARRPGYFVGLLRALATDRAAVARQLRTGIEAT